MIDGGSFIASCQEQSFCSLLWWSRLDINIESLYSKKEEKKIPVLSVVDDGSGMSHEDIMTMIAFGHSLPNEQQPDHIGRFGIGFKVGFCASTFVMFCVVSAGFRLKH
jgi:HSP90 family molecular chaperone